MRCPEHRVKVAHLPGPIGTCGRVEKASPGYFLRVMAANPVGETHNAAPRRQSRLPLRIVVVSYFFVVLVGFACGYLLASGDDVRRLAFGALGLAIGSISAWFVMLVVVVTISAARARRDARSTVG